MAAKRPKKPTLPFGYVAFSKNEGLEAVTNRLPEIKEEQEFAIVNLFADALARFCGRMIRNARQLGQSDHDAEMTVDGKRVVLQVTEIAPREIELPAGEVDPGDPKSIAFVIPGRSECVQKHSPKLKLSIQKSIEKKLGKRYAPEKSADMWLLIFTTSPLLLLGSEPIDTARQFLRTVSTDPFSEIWFMYALNFVKPVKIWPCDTDSYSP